MLSSRNNSGLVNIIADNVRVQNDLIANKMYYLTNNNQKIDLENYYIKIENQLDEILNISSPDDYVTVASVKAIKDYVANASVGTSYITNEYNYKTVNNQNCFETYEYLLNKKEIKNYIIKNNYLNNEEYNTHVKKINNTIKKNFYNNITNNEDYYYINKNYHVDAYFKNYNLDVFNDEFYNLIKKTFITNKNNSYYINNNDNYNLKKFITNNVYQKYFYNNIYNHLLNSNINKFITNNNNYNIKTFNNFDSSINSNINKSYIYNQKKLYVYDVNNNDNFFYKKFKGGRINNPLQIYSNDFLALELKRTYGLGGIALSFINGNNQEYKIGQTYNNKFFISITLNNTDNIIFEIDNNGNITNSNIQSIENDIINLQSNLSNNYYTQAEIDNIISQYYTKTDTNSILDNYYTKTEVNNIILNYYTQTQINNLLASYYTKTEADNRYLKLSGGTMTGLLKIDKITSGVHTPTTSQTNATVADDITIYTPLNKKFNIINYWGNSMLYATNNTGKITIPMGLNTAAISASVVSATGLTFDNTANRNINWSWNTAKIFSGYSSGTSENGLHINGGTYPIYLDNDTYLKGTTRFTGITKLNYQRTEVKQLRFVGSYSDETNYAGFQYLTYDNQLWCFIQGSTTTADDGVFRLEFGDNSSAPVDITVNGINNVNHSVFAGYEANRSTLNSGCGIKLTNGNNYGIYTGVAGGSNPLRWFVQTVSNNVVVASINSLGKMIVPGGFGTFTGSHYVNIEEYDENNIGKIVCVKKNTVKDIHNNNVDTQICNHIKCKLVYGVLTEKTNENSDPLEGNGDETEIITVNGVGEGSIIVSYTNGNIEAGDYLVSDGNGYVMKQDDDIYRNITVAKAIENVVWENEAATTKMIGCIYLCS